MFHSPEAVRRARFADRRDAGRVLAVRLAHYGGRRDVVVLALPRGGVPVAFEVARALEAPLDVFVVRKLGLPGHEELAMGAIASGGVRVLNQALLDEIAIPQSIIDRAAEREALELTRRELAYRGDRAPISVEDRVVILVDDGLATGSTMRAAVAALRRQSPKRIVVAVPIGAVQTCDAMHEAADEVVCAMTPEPFRAVGLWYADFDQTSDEEVRALLRETPSPGGAMPVSIPVGRTFLEGDLFVPARASGLVLFAHGSGSSRMSPRNRFVARRLCEKSNAATLLVDLLTAEEEAVDDRTRQLRFDIPLLAERLLAVREWAAGDPRTQALRVGYFGASTGAAAAILAAARHPSVHAIVSRGGRPDLAGADALARVVAPTLLIVGGNDEVVVGLNVRAQRQMRCETSLEIVPGATHLFEEPGALLEVAMLASAWFDRFF